ncbi:MAG: NosD domain-containing protein [Candidatus Bathyarchaeia archaeon]
MKNKMLPHIMLTILLISLITLTFNLKTVQAEDTIYIRPDGSVDPPTAPISRSGNIYTFTANINESIVIEKDNIIINGNGYTLQGAPPSYGFTLNNRNNVTIRNVFIIGFRYGIFLNFTTSNIIELNAMTNCDRGGIWLQNSTGNTIAKNAITNSYCGILLTWSNTTNTITNNTVRNNPFGIMLIGSTNNIITENTIANNTVAGIYLDRSDNNQIYHNNIIANTPQATISESTCTWDNGYPSGGNYWSDYTGTDNNHDGIGDTPYTIDENNTDRYPLINTRGTHDLAVTNTTISKTVIGQGYTATISITAQNQGTQTQIFDLTIYANTSIIQTLALYLLSGNTTTRTITWNTTGWTKGSYTLKASVTIIPAETDTADNTFTYGTVKITVPGDIDGDRDIDIYDIVKIASAYGAKIGEPRYLPNADIDGNGEINIYDVVIATSRYGYIE